ncbi:ABC transporter substrate-binding protein [Massilia sp. NR 4-1]|uniref:ABC transporter substrate-binding protein n=1 Tax=Massilia sp. NR 4-1 TaxID=1678028 RepID=UPI00067E1477|nr:ABC transporter substrate-binding protein [Massilia sp. NR 4-1]AKU21178.1 hypothetical protein ACZ75_06480 [Massilia sp. NR 4-1]
MPLLAARQINEAGGVLGKRLNAIALVARDNDEAQTMGQQLLDAGVQILNVSTSTRVLNLLPLARAKGVPILTESSSSPTLSTVADDDLVYRIGVSDVDATPVLAKVAFDAGKRRAVVVVNEGDAFGAGLNSLFTPAFQDLGGQVVRTVAIPFGLKSGFDAYLKQVFEAKPDVILNGILAADIAASRRQAGPRHRLQRRLRRHRLGRARRHRRPGSLHRFPARPRGPALGCVAANSHCPTTLNLRRFLILSVINLQIILSGEYKTL